MPRDMAPADEAGLVDVTDACEVYVTGGEATVVCDRAKLRELIEVHAETENPPEPAPTSQP